MRSGWHTVRALAALFAIVGISMAVPVRVAACSCMAMTPGEAAAASDVAFVGTAVHEEPLNGGDPVAGVLYTFEVEGVAKGQALPRIAVAGAGDGGDASAMCGMSFELNQRWMVFALREGDRLTTSLCAGNQPLERGDEAPLPLTAPTAGPPAEQSGGAPLAVLVPLGVVLGVGAFAVLVFRRAERGRAT